METVASSLSDLTKVTCDWASLYVVIDVRKSTGDFRASIVCVVLLGSAPLSRLRRSAAGGARPETLRTVCEINQTTIFLCLSLRY